jgi:NAD(P)-dependent dehydrogenase (short-subunit alcohol dehydrogenase family)
MTTQDFLGIRHPANSVASQIMGVPFGLTADGYELQWQVNYLAPFLFVSELLPLLLTTASTIQSKNRVRVVNLSSDMVTLLGPKQILLEDVNMTDQKGMTVLLWV